MNNITKKALSTLLVFTLLIGVFAALPITTSAADADQIALEIEAFDHGGIGTLNAVASGNIVTVSGSVTDATNSLMLDIDANVSVEWAASYSKNTDGTMIGLTGNGIFRLSQGGSLSKSGSGASILLSGVGTTLILSDGTVDNSTPGGIVIALSGTNLTVDVEGASLSAASPAGIAIFDNGANNSLNIYGGYITGPSPIVVNGNSHIFNMSGGEVYRDGVYDGYGAVSISGDSCNVGISGGTIFSESGLAFGAVNFTDTGTVNISGGIISAIDDVAVGILGPQLIITGGVITSSDHSAIVSSGNSSASIIGGFIFGIGSSVTGMGNATINHGSVTPSIGGSAVVVAWDKNAGGMTYNEASSNYLRVNTGASAKWARNNSAAGIDYSNGGNSGFYPISGISIDNATQISYTISFDSNGGSAVPSQTINAGEKATVPQVPTRSGYLFSGWYTNQSLTTAYNFGAAVNGNITLYAKWESSTSSSPSPSTSPPTSTAPSTSPSTSPSSSPLPQNASLDNFQKTGTYIPAMFIDVNEDFWYGSNREKAVENAYVYGLMSGYPDDSFRPNGNISLAEAITIAARVHKIYVTGEDDFVQGSIWYQVYVDYAIANGIIHAEDFSVYNRSATRAEMAYIFVSALPQSEFNKQNTVNSLPDVRAATPYYSFILMLYEAGVIGGSDELGTFHPDNNITRAEAAAIISRVIRPESRFSSRTY